MPSKPKLGQNFLRDTQAIERIANALGDLAGETVIEIGPGRGAITRAIAARAERVIAIELDGELASYLRGEFPAGRVRVVQADVLEFDFAAAAAEAGRRLPVAGNLPYYITSPILLKLAASHASLDRAVLMVQRDLMISTVSASFSSKNSSPAAWPCSACGVYSATRSSSRSRAISHLWGVSYAPAAIQESLARAGVPPQARAEALSLNELARLWIELQKETAAPTSGAALSD